MHASRTITEQDPDKMLQLFKEIDRLLGEKMTRLRNRWSEDNLPVTETGRKGI